MRHKNNAAKTNLTRLGWPEAGTVAALAIGQADRQTLYAGTPVGVYRLADDQDGPTGEWERLVQAPLGVLSLAASPQFAQDSTLLAGTSNGIFLSTDAGHTWRAAEMPIAGSSVVAIDFSPNYAADGILLAGTMEDGILYSNTRGSRWQSSGFGLLDAAAFCLGFSPNFAKDTTVFAGTDTTVYFSYNGARAWKQLTFPEGAAPALSLLVSPHFEHDQTLFVGTEMDGLHRSTDRGRSWHKLNLPAVCINTLLLSTPGQALLAATDAGVFESADWGETWTQLLDEPNAISLATAGETTVAGVVGQGVRRIGSAQAEALPILAARSFLGLALSPQFDRQPVAFLYGPQDGLWRSADGGLHWEDLGGELPSPDIAALALSPDFAINGVLVGASTAGVLVSTDSGGHWSRSVDEGAHLLACSPNGQVLAAAFASGAVRQTGDLGRTWQPVPGPWDAGGRVAALAVDDEGFYYAALLESMGKKLSVWFGRPDHFLKVLSRTVGDNPVISLYVSPQRVSEGAWYAACGNLVWKFDGRNELQAAQSAVFPASGPAESILFLTGTQTKTGEVLLAGTGQHVYKVSDGQAWRKVLNFGAERALAMALAPTYPVDKTVYLLLLGGAVCQAIIR